MFGIDKYDYLSSATFMDYTFESNGPKGKIQKVARFSIIDKKLYNFGFGDYDPITKGISDTVTSNNGDMDKIMGTLGSIVYDFTTIHLAAAILIQGSSTSRIRLYQNQIGRHWERINPVFDVLGYKGNEWEPFQKGKNYEAFLGNRKDAFFMS